MATPSKLCELPVLVARVAAALGDVAAVRPSWGGFALVEHVWHLAEIEGEAHQVRLARLATERTPWLADFDGDRIAHDRGYIARPLDAGLRAFRRARTTTVRELGRVPGERWLRGGIQEHVGYVTLGELPERILSHDRAHAIELAELLAELRPGDALVAELRGWAAAIAESPRSLCRRRVPRSPGRAALWLTRVERAIAASLSAGRLHTAALGRTLGMSPRTLQRRLADQGVTVRCLVDAALRARAVDRLRAGNDWRNTALELGFSDPRAFSRAFKRWTRVTPTAFQRAPAVTRRGCT